MTDKTLLVLVAPWLHEGVGVMGDWGIEMVGSTIPTSTPSPQHPNTHCDWAKRTFVSQSGHFNKILSGTYATHVENDGPACILHPESLRYTQCRL
ncbi:hypothetical protein HYR99_17075 [Candidatus Poribacteria bacterium]|nr:hypothetical protein [Candidatus Poribacteria bacterium]